MLQIRWTAEVRLMNAVALSSGGALAVLVAWASYLSTIPRGKVPVRPVGHIALQVVGAGLAVTGLLLALRGGGFPGVVVLGSTSFAVMMAGTFLFLLSQRKTPVGKIRVAVGDTMLPFTARTAEDTQFHSDELAGRRILFKFFRGGW
jgi:hypothetical protein